MTQQLSIQAGDFEVSTCGAEMSNDTVVELINSDFDMDLELTPRQARKLAHALLFMAEQAEEG